MKGGRIELTEEEAELAASIEVHEDPKRPTHSVYKRNVPRVERLYSLLLERKAIPQSRLAWFDSPDMNYRARGKSWRQMVQSNAGHHMPMHEIPYFHSVLQYFINGSDLPEDLKAEFARRVDACEHVSGSDAIDLGKWARTQVRQRKLDSLQAAEEFYKLALDLDVFRTSAKTIYESVKQAPATSNWWR